MEVEHELCNNCKKEIPQTNYVMHTLHCAKRLTLCQSCKEAIPKNEFEEHKKACRPPVPKAVKKPEVPLTNIERSSYFQERREVEERKATARRESYLDRHRYMEGGNVLGSTNNSSYDESNSRGGYARPKETYPRSNGIYQGTNDNYSRGSGVYNRGIDPDQGDHRDVRTDDRYSRSGSRYSNDYSRGREGFSDDLSRSRSYRSRPGNGQPSPQEDYSRPKEDYSRQKVDYSKTNGHQTSGRVRESGQNIIRDTTSVPVPSKPVVTPAETPPSKPKPAPLPQPAVKPKAKSDGLLPCRYCDLELPKLELEEHENYCGSRTDKCLECGELVMFKNKNIHMDYHRINGVGPPPRTGWDSQTQRTEVASIPSLRPEPFTPFTMVDAALYSALPNLNSPTPPPKEKGESYKEISRRLDCKTEYIRNLLHDSASITVPLRHNGAVPRNHFNHNKGPAPAPPRRRNPPTELSVPCEFCATPIPHDDLIRHEAGCRPDLLGRRRRSSPSSDDYYVAPPQHQQQQQPSSPEVELPSISPKKSSVKQHSSREGKSKKHQSKHTSSKSNHNKSVTLSRPVVTDFRHEEPNEGEAMIPCEFCKVQIPFDSIIQHETGCRPDLARLEGDALRRSPSVEEYDTSRHEDSPEEVEIPCEFCDSMIPASMFYYHQETCT